jgi:hypothetical protein
VPHAAAIAAAVLAPDPAAPPDHWYLHRDNLKLTAMAMIAGGDDQASFYALYLPGMGLLDADRPSNVASMVLQLQLAF